MIVKKIRPAKFGSVAYVVSNVIFRNYSSKTQWVFGLLFEIRHGTSRRGWVYVASFVQKVAVCN